VIERTDLEEMVAAVDVSDQPAGPDLATTIHELAGVVTSAFIRARKLGLTSGASQPHVSPRQAAADTGLDDHQRHGEGRPRVGAPPADERVGGKAQQDGQRW